MAKEKLKFNIVKDGEQKHVPFAVVEAYKTIRTNLTFLLSSGKKKIVTITSPNAGEGKSTTAVNMAIAFAQLGEKVLLIDADMRKASIHKKLKLENKLGLSNVLAGLCKREEAITAVSANLEVITSGQIPPNPSELLGSQSFKDLLDSLESEYSYIIIDTPPINVVADALLVAPLTAGLVIVVRDEFTPREAINQAISAAEFANINILGAIMNGANPKGKRRYNYRKYGNYKYKKYYRYSYGYGPTKK